MLNRYKDTLNLLEVNENQIAYNITLTKGVVYSQKLLSYLIQKGYDRNDAYDLIQKRSLEALSKQIDLLDLLKDDQSILKVISKEELNDIFDSKSYLKYVDDIYDKVFRKDN